jgi:enoyl-CoA hydratase/carnithine racemase
MEWILTGEFWDAKEAEKNGLVSKVFEPDQLVAEAIKLGERISSFSQPIVAMAKECVNYSFNSTLREGV